MNALHRKYFIKHYWTELTLGCPWTITAYCIIVPLNRADTLILKGLTFWKVDKCLPSRGTGQKIISSLFQKDVFGRDITLTSLRHRSLSQCSWKYLQPVAAFMICHAEVNLHADRTSMNAHTSFLVHHCRIVFFFIIIFYNILYCVILHWYKEPFLVEFCKVYGIANTSKYVAPDPFCHVFISFYIYYFVLAVMRLNFFVLTCQIFSMSVCKMLYFVVLFLFLHMLVLKLI